MGEHHVHYRLTLSLYAIRIYSIRPFGQIIRFSFTKAIPFHRCWCMLVTRACRSLGNSSLLLDNSRHICDSYFSWSKVRLLLLNMCRMNSPLLGNQRVQACIVSYCTPAVLDSFKQIILSFQQQLSMKALKMVCLLITPRPFETVSENDHSSVGMS